MKVGDLEKIINDEFCSSDKPNNTQSCVSRPCDETEWIVSEWSGVCMTFKLSYILKKYLRIDEKNFNY